MLVNLGGGNLFGIVAGFFEGGEDLCLVFVAKGFQSYFQLYASLPIQVDKLIVLQLDGVAVFLGQYFSHMQKFTRPVGKHDREGEYPPAPYQAVLNQGGDGDYVHIAAGEDRHYIFRPSSA